MSALQDLWLSVRGRHGSIPGPAGFHPALPEDDEPESLMVAGTEPPSGPLDSVSGFACVIAYRDARGRPSQRRVTCIRLERANSIQYLRAFCHEREANRQFRLDRVEAVVDAHTGEILSESAFQYFSQFRMDFEQSSGFNWGLSVMQKCDLVAGINALVFMARCDREWHPAEEEAIERFVVSYWLRNELPGEPPLEDIMAHAKRLSPDPEVFYISLTRCHESPSLARIIRRAIQRVIEADDRIHDHELYWGSAVDEYFRQLAA